VVIFIINIIIVINYENIFCSGLSEFYIDLFYSLLGSIMIAVILLSRRFHVNPDNVATPIAASLGDLTTISLLAAVSMFLFNTRGMLLMFIGCNPMW